MMPCRFHAGWVGGGGDREGTYSYLVAPCVDESKL